MVSGGRGREERGNRGRRRVGGREEEVERGGKRVGEEEGKRRMGEEERGSWRRVKEEGR